MSTDESPPTANSAGITSTASPMMAPPTVPAELIPSPAPPAWPAALGVVAIVFGSLGALAAVWGILGSSIMNVPEAQQMVERFRVPSLILGSFSIAAALMLPISGIGLLCRRRWGCRMMWIWAVAKIFIALLSALLGYLNFEQMMRDQTIPAGASPMMGIFSLVGIFVGLLWAWALPVFVFFWFGREQVREEVRTWR